ncbi:MAG: hypothetical protein M0P19_05410 [Nevskia sp.]|jgi:hypothetical protein|nr:hypothetical protein [Nevskia sp.]MCK9385627.1 hypothetical protein [Nevskia sp.]
MNTSKTGVFENIDSLAQLRDELALQAHLMQAEAKDRWLDLETQWDHFQREASTARAVAGKSADEVGAALGLLGETLRQGYTDLKKALQG